MRQKSQLIGQKARVTHSIMTSTQILGMIKIGVPIKHDHGSEMMESLDSLTRADFSTKDGGSECMDSKGFSLKKLTFESLYEHLNSQDI